MYFRVYLVAYGYVDTRLSLMYRLPSKLTANTHTESVRKVFNHLQYLEDRIHLFDATWNPIKTGPYNACVNRDFSGVFFFFLSTLRLYCVCVTMTE